MSNFTNNCLTIKMLKDDEVSYDMGFWKLPLQIHGKHTDLIISEDKGDYILAVAMPIRVVGRSKTLAGIVSAFNNFVSLAQIHDITVVQNDKRARVMVGR